MFYWLFVLGILKNSSKKVSPCETCGLTKYRPPSHVSFLQFSQNIKKATAQNYKESLMEMEDIKEKLLCVYGSHY